MPYVGTIAKQSSETFLVTVDFATNRLKSGEGIASKTVTATQLSDGTTVTTTVINSAAEAESSGIITIMPRAGTSGQIYKITVKATTDATPPAVHEADILMEVSDT